MEVGHAIMGANKNERQTAKLNYSAMSGKTTYIYLTYIYNIARATSAVQDYDSVRLKTYLKILSSQRHGQVENTSFRAEIEARPVDR